MTLGERLKTLRESHKLSRQELAEKLGLSYWAIAKYEQDERDPDHDTLGKMASLFGVSIDYLLGRDPSTPPWWYRDTPPSDVEIEEFLKTANVHFNGAPLDEEDKEDIITLLRVKWERERRKRRKESDDKP